MYIFYKLYKVSKIYDISHFVGILRQVGSPNETKIILKKIHLIWFLTMNADFWQNGVSNHRVEEKRPPAFGLSWEFYWVLGNLHWAYIFFSCFSVAFTFDWPFTGNNWLTSGLKKKEIIFWFHKKTQSWS